MKGRKSAKANIPIGLAVLEAMIAENYDCPICGCPIRSHFPITFEVQGAACGVTRERMRQIAEQGFKRARIRAPELKHFLGDLSEKGREAL